jgi:hypothetical protein
MFLEPLLLAAHLAKAALGISGLVGFHFSPDMLIAQAIGSDDRNPKVYITYHSRIPLAAHPHQIHFAFLAVCLQWALVVATDIGNLRPESSQREILSLDIKRRVRSS